MKPAAQCESIEEVRKCIDDIDESIIKLLGERFRYVKEVVRFKEPSRESIIAKERLESVITSRRKMASENGLNPDIIEGMYRNLINHFIEEEIKIINLE